MTTLTLLIFIGILIITIPSVFIIEKVLKSSKKYEVIPINVGPYVVETSKLLMEIDSSLEPIYDSGEYPGFQFKESKGLIPGLILIADQDPVRSYFGFECFDTVFLEQYDDYDYQKNDIVAFLVWYTNTPFIVKLGKIVNKVIVKPTDSESSSLGEEIETYDVALSDVELSKDYTGSFLNIRKTDIYGLVKYKEII